MTLPATCIGKMMKSVDLTDFTITSELRGAGVSVASILRHWHSAHSGSVFRCPLAVCVVDEKYRAAFSRWLHGDKTFDSKPACLPSSEFRSFDLLSAAV